MAELTQTYGTDELVKYQYTYDGNGNITEVKENGIITAKYTYDELNQLVWSGDKNTNLYTQIVYDNAGNITRTDIYSLGSNWAPVKLLETKTYTYGDSNWCDKLTGYNGTAITYDAVGNPLSYRDGMSFTWQNGRELASLQTEDNSVTYKYDNNGMRTQKDADGVKTNYYYDSSNNLIGLSKGNNTLLFYYNSNGNVTSFKYNGELYYYIKNLQGDIVKIIDQSGAEAASYKYDSWGKITAESGTSVIRELNPFRYRGYVYDIETGLYYLQSRYYDPITGRFLNADVYCDTGNSVLSTNMFAYCENNAVMRYDVTGKDAWWIQSPSSAGGKGHTSLLIQEKPGFWWYFYWGPSSVQLLFIGTTTLKDIDKNVRDQINYYNKHYSSKLGLGKIKYEEKYNQTIKFSGDFKKSITEIKKHLNKNKEQFYYTNVHIDVKKVKYDALTKFRMSSKYKYKNKSYSRPYSYILYNNKSYNVVFNNCLHASIYYLKYGKLNKNNDKFQKQLKGKYLIPNNAINDFKKFGIYAKL